MKCVEITPHKLIGKVTVPPSKSVAHRAVICAAFAKGTSIIKPIEFSQDIKATIESAKSLGADIKQIGNELHITGGMDNTENIIINAEESGSTLRFFIPIALTKNRNTTFIGKGKLPTRPLQTFYDIFDTIGIEYRPTNGGLPLKVSGELKAGTYRMRGDISSQFITGLLFALPVLNGDSIIEITTTLESSGYIDLTIETMKSFGVVIEKNKEGNFLIKGNQSYTPCNYTVEGDFSQVAFWLTGGVLNGDIECTGLNPSSKQGDFAIINLLSQFGGNIIKGNSIISRTPPSQLKGIAIDARQIPDLVPILAVTAAFAQGETKIYNASRLRIKECDRLRAMYTELKKLGANIIELQDSLIIQGKDFLEGGICDSWNDHRIVMALSIAATRCKNNVTITGSNAITKSYPNFFEHYKMLGGAVREFDMG